MMIVVTYDITDDRRREEIAMLLSGYGPRVQLSVFECEVSSADELRRLRSDLRDHIDPLEDQIRIYPTNQQTFAERYIIGARTRGGTLRLLDSALTCTGAIAQLRPTARPRRAGR
jgi:CRISPR-associated protein Cas2